MNTKLQDFRDCRMQNPASRNASPRPSAAKAHRYRKAGPKADLPQFDGFNRS
jgi:hypothetical protein